MNLPQPLLLNSFFRKMELSADCVVNYEQHRQMWDAVSYFLDTFSAARGSWPNLFRLSIEHIDSMNYEILWTACVSDDMNARFTACCVASGIIIATFRDRLMILSWPSAVACLIAASQNELLDYNLATCDLLATAARLEYASDNLVAPNALGLLHLGIHLLTLRIHEISRPVLLDHGIVAVGRSVEAVPTAIDFDSAQSHVLWGRIFSMLNVLVKDTQKS